MNNSFYPTLSSQACNFGNINNNIDEDVQMITSDASVTEGTYGSNYYNFFRESQLTNDQYLGSFSPLSTVDIPPPPPSLTHLNLSASSLTAGGSSTSSMPIYNVNAVSQPQYPPDGFSLENNQANKYSPLERSKKRKGPIFLEDKGSLVFPKAPPTKKVPVKKSHRIADKAAILQNLVNPYGKTDTASALEDAAKYIRIMHEKIKNLSNPYFRDPRFHQLQLPQGRAEKKDIRSKGLCLVPISLANNITKEDEAKNGSPTITRLMFS